MTIVREFSAAARPLRKHLGFTIAVVAMLGIGIGATTTIFSVADGVLFAPLPVANESRLMAIINTGPRRADYISWLDFADVRSAVKSFDEAGAYYEGPATLTGDGDPVGVGIADVTANWFSMLGIGVELGRAFALGEDGPNAASIVVISDALWRTHFGGDRSVLGHRVTINGVDHTIVGVALPKMAFPRKFDMWRPVHTGAIELAATSRGNRLFQSVVRLAPGASPERARAELKAVTARLHDQYPEAETGLSFDLMPMRQHMVGESRDALLVLIAAVGCVLLIACANVAGLLLLRARQRTQEIGIRLALGASPRRVVREMLAESIAYGIAGGVVGVAIAEIAVRAIVALQPGGLVFLEDVSVDWRVLIFAAAVTIATSVIFGIVPAIFASKTDLVEALASGTRSTSAGKRSSIMRQAFVVLELALALVLLVGAGLLGRSFQKLTSVDVGFRPAGLARFDLLLPSSWTGPAASTFINRLVSDLSTVPGTQSVAAGFGAPFTGPAINLISTHIDGQAPEALDRPTRTLWKSVTPGYFETLGVPLVRGRVLTDRDRSNTAPVVIVNEAFVNAYLDGAEPLGKTVTDHGEIVGVVGDMKNGSLRDGHEPAIYYALDQVPVGYVTVLIRSTAEPSAVLSVARKRLALLDNSLRVSEPGSYDDLIRSTTVQARFSWELIAGFSAFALLLAGTGIYGVVAFAVRQRQREFGIRIALGAQRQQISALVLGHGVKLAVLGVGIGLACSLAATALLKSMLYGVGATDLETYAAGCVVLTVATLAASWLPALHASRVDPIVVMRSE